jgi:hypothetical protein
VVFPRTVVRILPSREDVSKAIEVAPVLRRFPDHVHESPTEDVPVRLRRTVRRVLVRSVGDRCTRCDAICAGQLEVLVEDRGQPLGDFRVAGVGRVDAVVEVARTDPACSVHEVDPAVAGCGAG